MIQDEFALSIKQQVRSNSWKHHFYSSWDQFNFPTFAHTKHFYNIYTQWKDKLKVITQPTKSVHHIKVQVKYTNFSHKYLHAMNEYEHSY